MKLGTQTGSVVNHIYSRATIGQPRPVVGMGATELLWSDRHAATITKVTELTSKRWLYEIEVVCDKATVISGSGHDGSAEYSYEPGTGTPNIYRSRREGGEWVQVFLNKDTGKVCQAVGGGRGLRIGDRDEYRDPSF